MKAEADLSPMGITKMIESFIEYQKISKKVTIIANDTGGAFAQILISINPDIVSRLILTSCDAFKNFLPSFYFYLKYFTYFPGVIFLFKLLMKMKFMAYSPFFYGWVYKHYVDYHILLRFMNPMINDVLIQRDVVKFLRSVDNKFVVFLFNLLLFLCF